MIDNPNPLQVPEFQQDVAPATADAPEGVDSLTAMLIDGINSRMNDIGSGMKNAAMKIVPQTFVAAAVGVHSLLSGGSHSAIDTDRSAAHAPAPEHSAQAAAPSAEETLKETLKAQGIDPVMLRDAMQSNPINSLAGIEVDAGETLGKLPSPITGGKGQSQSKSMPSPARNLTPSLPPLPA